MKYSPDFSDMRKYVIWSKDIGNITDWEDFLEEENLLDSPEEIQRNAIIKMNDTYLDDEYLNLDLLMPGQIIAIGDRDFSIMGSNLNQILDFDAWELAADKENIYADSMDETVLFRFIPDNVDPRPLLGHIYLGDYTPELISEFTKSLRPYVAAIYGWKGEQASLAGCVKNHEFKTSKKSHFKKSFVYGSNHNTKQINDTKKIKRNNLGR